MGTKNNNLARAKAAKNDEFYTQLSDIENELRHYKEHFRGKVIFCNCDDPYESNFFKYFAMNFRELGIKKLISTSYATSKIAFNQLQFDGRDIDIITKKNPYKIELERVEDINGDGAIDLEDVELMLKKEPPKVLEGDGDFRSEECVELLKQADIVVSNPPFSLFREYIGQLMEYKKDFIILGNMNALNYLIPLVKEKKIWYGVSIHSGDREFMVPDTYPLNASGARIDENGNKYIRVKGVRWFTNLDYPARHEKLALWKNYTAEEYPVYDNYAAINVDKYSEIPCDYNGVMGVPISFMDYYCPEQFDIIGITYSKDRNADIEALRTDTKHRHVGIINRKEKYPRVLIRKKTCA